MPDRGVGRLGCPPEVGVSPTLLFVAFGFSHPTHLAGNAARSPKFGCHELGLHLPGMIFFQYLFMGDGIQLGGAFVGLLFCGVGD